jgi:phage tail P2-like protein
MKYTFDYANATDASALTHEVAISLDEAKAFIDQLLNSFDIEACPVENLNIIANILGFPVNKEDDPDFMRRSLRNAIALYKAKGTADSVKVLFYNLGFYVDVVPLWTPDFTESVQIFPPYVKATISKITSGNPYKPGYYDITIINPDNQSDTSVGAFQYLNLI